LAAGAVTLAAASGAAAAAQERKKVVEEPKKGDGPKQAERTFTGESKEGKIQEALDQALGALGKALGDGGVADAQATWKVATVGGLMGGIVGARGVKVTITATRTPDWPSK
jgi:hypothetical protein